MDLFVHPPKQPRPQPSGVPAPSANLAPFVVAGAVSLFVAALAIMWFIKTTVARFIVAHPAAGTALAVLLYAFVVALALAAIAGVILVVAGAFKRVGMVTPKPGGIVPVSLKTLKTTGMDVDSLRAMQRTDYARARRIIPEGVHTVTSLPHQAPDIIDAEVVEVAPSNVPPLSALLRDGLIKPGQFCIGWDGEKFIYGTWEDFCTIGAGGTMGTGKSNDGAFYLAQVLAVGGQGYVADPNAGHSQSLANRLGRMKELLAADVAKDPDDILKLVQRVRRLLAQRIATNDEGEVPVILLIDEFTALMLDEALAVELPKLLSIINTQGRKYGVFVFLLAQLWGAEMTGGTKVRNLLAGRICHNLPAQEARNLLGLPASSMPKDISSLRRGECYVRTLQGALHRVTIPLVDAEGVADLRRRVAGGSGEVIDSVVDSGLIGAGSTVPLRVVSAIGSTPDQSEINPSINQTIGPALAKLAEVVDQDADFLRKWIAKQIRASKSLPQIAKTIHPAAENGGYSYTMAMAAITEVIREGFGTEEE